MWTIYALFLSFALEPVRELSPEVGVREKQLEAQPSELKVTHTAEQNLSYTMPAEQEFDSLRRVTANPYADVLHPTYAHYANPVQLRATKSAKTMPAGQDFDSLRRVTNISRKTLYPIHADHGGATLRRLIENVPVRIAWHHVPKCGTSFGNTLVHWANQSLPEHVDIGDDERGLMEAYPPKAWFWDDGPIFWMKDDNFGNHFAVDDATFESYQGRFVGLFRDPALRAASAYDWFTMDEQINGSRVTKEEYARRIRGSQTTQLAGQQFGLSCLWMKYGCRAVIPDVDKAVDRLSGFAFVGLTDLYDLSVCLFHAMHGGRCLPVEFTNTRPARDQALLPGSFTAWGGMVDGYDWRLYSEATRIFFERLQQYGVNEAKCLALCPEGGDRFVQYRDIFLSRGL